MNSLEKLKFVLDFNTAEKLYKEGKVEVTVKEIIDMCKQNIEISKETLRNIERINENDNIKKSLDEGANSMIKMNKEVIDALQFVEPNKVITFKKD